MMTTNEHMRAKSKRRAGGWRWAAMSLVLAGLSQFLIGGCDPTEDVGHTIMITATDRVAKESDLSTATFKISINKWLQKDLTVEYAVSGTATNGGDYVSLSGTATIDAGELSTTITVTPYDDAIDEGDSETVYVAIFKPDGYSSSQRSATIVIKDDDDPVIPTAQVLTTDPTANEGGDTGQFLISLNAYTASPVTVHYTLGGTATPGTDFDDTELATGEVTLPAGVSSATIDVTPIDDAGTWEDQETVTVTLDPDPLDPDTYVVGPSSFATVSIIDDDAPVATIATTAPVATEAGTSGEFMVTMSKPVTADTTVNYTVSGSATEGDDYFTMLRTVVVTNGQSSAVIPVLPKDDTDLEGPESVIVTLAPATATEYTVGAEDSAEVIISGEEAPTVSVVATDSSASETGGAGQFKLELNQIVATDVVITYLAGGTAETDGTDYAVLSGTATIPAGQQLVLIDVIPVLDYDDAEGDETVILTLNNGPGYLVDVAKSSADVIISDYSVPVISVAKGIDAFEESAALGRFTITISSATAEPLTIAYAVEGSSTATSGDDYSALPGSVTVPSGFSGTIDVVVTPEDDSETEDDETVVLTVSSSATGAYKLDPNPANRTATVIIVDND